MEIKNEALNSAYEYINNLKIGIDNLSSNINSGHEEQGINLIPQVSDGIDWLIKVINLNSNLINGKSFVENLNEKIKEIIEALENEDYILVGDLFNYEIIPILDEIKNEIKEIIIK